MDKNEATNLTQDELVASLHELGYTDVTKRRVALWRANEILPSFDIIGSGRGRQRGRESNAWSNGAEVLKQAVQVYELLKMYKTFNELYLPLWMHNCKVPLEPVRAALIGPLETAVRDADVRVNGRNAVEDDIDDAAFTLSELIQGSNIKLFGIPPEALAALVNVVINNDYDLEDQPFLDGKEALQEFDQTVEESCAEMFGDDVASRVSQSKPTDTMWTILTHAPFINKYLTVQHLKEALDGCTIEDLASVQRDLQVVREILLLFKPMIEILMPFMPGAQRKLSAENLTSIYNAGKVLIWVDMSLRRNGYGMWIDHLLSTMLSEIKKDMNEEVKQGLVEAGPHIAVAMETVFAQLGVSLNDLEGLSPQ
jgi:hypothetical protein